jgi:hypothetical protein
VYIEHLGVQSLPNSDETSENSSNLHGTTPKRVLTLSGRMKEADISCESSYSYDIDYYEDKEHVRWLGKVRDPATGCNIGHIAFDSHPSEVLVSSIFCLLCIARKNNDRWQLICLALVPTDDSRNEHCRIGLVFLQDMSWFSGPAIVVTRPRFVNVDSWRAKDMLNLTTIRLV